MNPRPLAAKLSSTARRAWPSGRPNRLARSDRARATELTDGPAGRSSSPAASSWAKLEGLPVLAISPHGQLIASRWAAIALCIMQAQSLRRQWFPQGSVESGAAHARQMWSDRRLPVPSGRWPRAFRPSPPVPRTCKPRSQHNRNNSQIKQQPMSDKFTVCSHP